MHYRKIDLSDEIFVIDVNGYIGNSTRKEIDYARKNVKVIHYYSESVTNSSGEKMFCINPIRIYAGVEICQIYYHSIQGDFMPYRSSKYQDNRSIQPSMLYKDFA